MFTAPDPQLDSEASAIPETFSSFVYQQRELVTEDDTVTDNEPLFGINILPLAASSRRGPVQTTRLPLLKLTEVFNTHWAAAVRSAQEDIRKNRSRP